jgi:hypothetical protein
LRHEWSPQKLLWQVCDHVKMTKASDTRQPKTLRRKVVVIGLAWELKQAAVFLAPSAGALTTGVTNRDQIYKAS